MKLLTTIDSCRQGRTKLHPVRQLVIPFPVAKQPNQQHSGLSENRKEKQRKLILHFDVRNTIIVFDSATQDDVEQALNSFLTGVAWGREDPTGAGWDWCDDQPSLTAPCPGAITYYRSRERELVRSPADGFCFDARPATSRGSRSAAVSGRTSTNISDCSSGFLGIRTRMLLTVDPVQLMFRCRTAVYGGIPTGSVRCLTKPETDVACDTRNGFKSEVRQLEDVARTLIIRHNHMSSIIIQTVIGIRYKWRQKSTNLVSKSDVKTGSSNTNRKSLPTVV